MTVAEIRTRLQEALKFDAAYALKKISSEQITKDLLRCEATGATVKSGDPVTEARRMLKCRFGLPMEKTTLSALTTNEDPQFLSRLMKNPNLPKYLQALPAYYRN